MSTDMRKVKLIGELPRKACFLGVQMCCTQGQIIFGNMEPCEAALEQNFLLMFSPSPQQKNKGSKVSRLYLTTDLILTVAPEQLQG
jgi:hypothetical protein